ncbi:MAG: SpoIIE family protein phosphatase, partial [Spirochaetes bacterium]|nr:SpoIIE family protein phosphatase [Spirochaetota bacterium]
FFVHDKVLEDQDKVTRKIMMTPIPAKDSVFQLVSESESPVNIKRSMDDQSRDILKSRLKSFSNNFGALLAHRIVIDNQLFGLIILNKLYQDYSDTDLGFIPALSSFSGVLISNIRSKAVEKEKERLENEMVIAERIQTGILPKNYQIQGYQIYAHMKPAEEVGGDYYDILNAPDGNFWVNIGDVTGHGVTSGLIMMMLQTSASSIIHSRPNITPEKLIVHCNKIMFDNIQNRLLLDQFITSCFIKFYPSGIFQFSGAHEDMLVYRKKENKIKKIKTRGIWLGLMEDISHGTELKTSRLDSGDILFIFTDGVIEIKNKENEQFDLHGLVQFFQNSNKAIPEKIGQQLMVELNRFKDKQKDDITFVIIKKE